MKVRCSAFNYDTNEWAELDVSVDLKLYPCCAYQGYYELNKWDDPRFLILPQNWNDLRVHDMEEIKKNMFSILNLENFNSGKAPDKCKEFCGVGIEEKHMPNRNKIIPIHKKE
jgi:hypothetical protein